MTMLAITDVLRGEGFPSAARRIDERIRESFAPRYRSPRAEIVNVAPAGLAARTGGIAVQLAARLRAERALRDVMLSRELRHAHAVHLEDVSGVNLEDVLRLRDAGVKIVLSLHDFALYCARPNLIEEPAGEFCFYSRDLERCGRCLARDHARHRAMGRELLQTATGVIFPSRFAFDRHRELFDLPDLAAEVIEPAVLGAPHLDGARDAVAFAGAVRRHKGGHLLPRIAPHTELHVFGGGDPELLRALRDHPNVTVHGYYRAATLPALLAKHRVGLVLLPSIFPETYSIALTETWLAGAAAAVFDHAAPAERIREAGGGWIAPYASGAEGMLAIIERWRAGERVNIPRVTATPEAAARAHVAFYARSIFSRAL